MIACRFSRKPLSWFHRNTALRRVNFLASNSRIIDLRIECRLPENIVAWKPSSSILGRRITTSTDRLRTLGDIDDPNEMLEKIEFLWQKRKKLESSGNENLNIQFEGNNITATWMESLQVITRYRRLIKSASIKGQWNLLKDLQMKASDQNISLPDSIIGYIINRFRTAGKFNEALDVLDKAIAGRGGLAGPETYLQASRALARTHEWKRAVGLIKDMINADMQPALKIYENVISTLCKSKQLEAALKLMNNLENAGVNLSADHYRWILELCQLQRNLSTAIALMTRIEAKNCKPCSRCYAAVIHTSVKCSQPEKGVDFLRKVQEAGIELDAIIAYPAMLAFSSLKLHEDSIELGRKLKDLGKPLGLRCIACLIQSNLALNRSEESVHLSQEALKFLVCPFKSSTVWAFEYVIEAFGRAKMWNKVEETLEKLNAVLELSPQRVGIYKAGLYAAQECDQVEVFEKWIEAFWMPNIDSKNIERVDLIQDSYSEDKMKIEKWL